MVPSREMGANWLRYVHQILEAKSGWNADCVSAAVGAKLWVPTLELVADDMVRRLPDVDVVAAVETELPTRLVSLLKDEETRLWPGVEDVEEA